MVEPMLGIAEDNKIFTPHGVRYVSNFTSEEIPSYNFKNKYFQFSLVDRAKYSGISSIVIKLIFENNLSLKVTPKQPIYTTDKIKEAEKIEVGDEVYIQYHLPFIPSEKYRNSEYELLGWLYTGNLFKKHLNKKNDINTLERFREEFYSKIFEHNYDFDEDEFDLELISHILGNVSTYGIAISEISKDFPGSFYNWDLTKQLSFIRGLFVSSAEVTKKRIEFYSNSKKITEEVQTFLALLGIYSTYKRKLRNYVLTIVNKDVARFITGIGFPLFHVKGYSYSSFVGDKKTLKLKRKEFKSNCSVYTFAVPSLLNFYVNGILVHSI